MATFKRLIVSGALCFASQAVFAAQYTKVEISDHDGFIDIDLPIAQVTQAQGVVKIIARGTVAGVSVGFEIDFPTESNRQAGMPGQLKLGTARIRSLGADSNRFVALLSRRYGVTGAASTMVSSLDASAVGLGDDSAHLLDGKKNMKFFFFDAGPEDRYAEVYINVDFNTRVLEFHEKDPGYRKPLLLALTRGIK